VKSPAVPPEIKEVQQKTGRRLQVGVDKKNKVPIKGEKTQRSLNTITAQVVARGYIEPGLGAKRREGPTPQKTA